MLLLNVKILLMWSQSTVEFFSYSPAPLGVLGISPAPKGISSRPGQTNIRQTQNLGKRKEGCPQALIQSRHPPSAQG